MQFLWPPSDLSNNKLYLYIFQGDSVLMSLGPVAEKDRFSGEDLCVLSKSEPWVHVGFLTKKKKKKKKEERKNQLISALVVSFSHSLSETWFEKWNE